MTAYKLHDRLGYKVSRLARLMESRLERMLADLGITRLMWCVLCGVGLEDVRTPSDLADYIGITRPAVSRLLRTMQTKGLIRRNGHDSDGRGVRVALTEDGLQTLTQARRAVEILNAHFTDKLGTEALDQVKAGLDRLSDGEDTKLTRL